MVRRLFLARGQQLAVAGLLDQAEDVTHLTLAEALADDPATQSGLRATVAQRAAELDAYEQMPAYRRVEFAGGVLPRTGTGQAQLAQADSSAARWSGTGCAPGQAVAEAVIVRRVPRPGASRGKILVTQTTDPGWVFHLAEAAGVVCEKGSLLSHTAIVARELGVPFVAGLVGATEFLRDGDRLKIDGATGLVERLADGAATAVQAEAGVDPG
jgi:pyruvate,water dikinase